MLESLEGRCLPSTSPPVVEFSLPPTVTNPTTQLNGPDNMVTGPGGSMYFTNLGTLPSVGGPSIARVSRGRAVTEIPTPVAVFSMVIGTDGNIWFGGHNYIGEVTPDGQLLHDYHIPSADHSPYPWSALSIALDPQGKVWYTEAYVSSLVGWILPTADLQTSPDQQVTPDADHMKEFSLPFDVAGWAKGPDGKPWIDPNGALWFEATGVNAIGRVNRDTNAPDGVNAADPIDVFTLPPPSREWKRAPRAQRRPRRQPLDDLRRTGLRRQGSHPAV